METEGGCAIFMVVGFIFVFFAYWMSRIQRESTADVFSSLARRWNGRVDPGDFLTNPRLEIQVDGVPGEVTYQTGGKNRSPWTRVHFNWRSRNRLRVAPEGFSTWIQRAFGSADLRIGDLRFDESFWIESSDAQWAREVLTPEIRRGLLKQRNSSVWTGQNNATLDVGPGGLILSFSRRLVDDRSSLEAFIELAIAVLRSCRGDGAVAGVVIAAVETKGGSECPVCGHPVEQGVTCGTCGTPHHADCWKYLGGCAIFGCQGKVKSRER